MGIWRVIRRFILPPRTDFYGLATEGHRVPAPELAVAEAALAGSGPIGKRFVAQLRDAPNVWRLVGEDGSYELRVSTVKRVRDVPRAGWNSTWIPVRALPARRLELRLQVARSGIMELHGRALDGQRWPRDWRAEPADLDAIRARAPWMKLPTPTELREERTRAIATIEAWLGETRFLGSKRGVVSIEPPATAEAIAAFEHAQQFELPAAYRDLLLLADGIEIGPVVVMGTGDAYRLDIPGPDRLVIAPPDEEGAFVLAPNGEVRFVDLESSSSDGRLRAPSLREWVRARSGAKPERPTGART